jgi:Domain of unknown function (DUF5753)
VCSRAWVACVNVKGREVVAGPFADDPGCKEFADNLARMLDGFGWSRADLAARCNYSVGVLNNILAFQRKPLILQGEAFDRAFGVVGFFAAKAKAIQGKAYAEAFEEFPAHEAKADDLYLYEHHVFPGLLQTERYMRAVLSAWPNITADEVERRVNGRAERQEILRREGSRRPRVWALVDETALRRPVASPEVMYEQCTQALELSALPHVSLALVPWQAARWHVGMLGACAIVERDGSPRVANLDDFADGRVSEDSVIVQRAALRFRTLQAEAMPTTASRDMIARMAEELWRGTAPTGARALTVAATEATA